MSTENVAEKEPQTTEKQANKGLYLMNIYIISYFNVIFLLVDILLNSTGNVPIMKKKKWSVDQDKPISWIIAFIHKYLKLGIDEKLVWNSVRN